MGKMKKCTKKNRLRKQIYLDWLPTEILEIVLEKMQSFAAIERAGAVTSRFGAIGNRLMKRAVGSIIKRAKKKGGQKEQACLAALKAFSACVPFRRLPGGMLDVCNEIIAGKRSFHWNVMSAMSVINKFHNNDLRDTRKFTDSRRRYHHILSVIRILQSCNEECHKAVTQTCPEMVTYNFTLFGCWLGLVWRGRNSNKLVYGEDNREILDVLSRLSFATNAKHPFRKFKHWHGRQRTCVLGYENCRSARFIKLEITANVYSPDADAIECFRQSLVTFRWDTLDLRNVAEGAVDSALPYDVDDVDLRMTIFFDSRQALSWGCDRRFSYNVGWNGYEEQIIQL